MELLLDGHGETAAGRKSGEAPTAMTGHARPGEGHENLLELVVQVDNIEQAIKRVKANKGSPGIDGMEVQQLQGFMDAHGAALVGQLLEGSYQPSPVKRCEIPKTGGGMRELGIPTTVDRMVQQALLQVLQPRIDPTFSEHSYGFRPGRSAHQAVRSAHQFVRDGFSHVVDVDLSKFFDRVNHDVLMGLLSKRIGDKRVLALIRRYLSTGIMVHGVVMERYEGTPQGGPLSPLLANVMLDEVDRQLERRGHRFCRYADDCNVYVRSKRAGERVMAALRAMYARLRLKVNEDKSAVATVFERQFLGFTFFKKHNGETIIAVAPKKIVTVMERLRELTQPGSGKLDEVYRKVADFLRGWLAYFSIARGRRYSLGPVEKWLRHRLRMLALKAWKHPKRTWRKLRALGAPERLAAEAAAHCRRRWAIAKHPALHLVFPNAFFLTKGIPKLT